MMPQANEQEVKLFFEILNKNNVEYLVIGGAAVNIHGYTRATGDLDLWYNPSKENFLNLLRSINEFGFDTSDLNKVTEYDTKGFIRLPLQNFYIEVMAIIDGKMKFEEVYKRSFDFSMEGVNVKVIGYDDLIQNKIMSRRIKDIDDITQLDRVKKMQKGKGDAS
jgi:predicted nucleotidyltransferase